MKSPIAPLLLLTLCAQGAHAQNAADARFAATTLNVSAYGEVKPPPDMAAITLGVETSQPTAAQAMSANAARMNRVIAALKNAGVPDRDIQTSQLDLSPQYAYPQGQPQQLTGYRASNQVTVIEDDITKLGSLADVVVSAGATNIGQISFGLMNPVAAENAARVAAVKALEDKAALYANATGYRIGRLVNLNEGGGYQPAAPRPMMFTAGFRAEAPTPVAAGVVSVRVDVSGVFELVK